MLMLSHAWKRVAAHLGLYRNENYTLPPETMKQMEKIPDQLDRIIEKRIRNNIIESAYLERLRRDGRGNVN